MLIFVRSPRFALTPAILQHAEDRVGAALGFARRVIREVAVTVDDVNAARGGVDKVCRVVAHCRRGASVVAEARDGDLYAAAARAARRARREIVREVRRRTARERGDRQRAGALMPA